MSLLSEQTILNLTRPSCLRAIHGAFPFTWTYSSKSAKRAGEVMLSKIAKFLGDFFDREVAGA
jgi:hypothetical protein